MNISKTSFSSQFPTLTEQGKIKEQIANGNSLNIFVDQIAKNTFDQPKDLNLLKAERNIYLLDEAIQGKRNFYHSSLYGKLCYILSKIFKSPIQKAEEVKLQLLHSINPKEAQAIQQELLSSLNPTLINLYTHNIEQSEKLLETCFLYLENLIVLHQNHNDLKKINPNDSKMILELINCKRKLILTKYMKNFSEAVKPFEDIEQSYFDGKNIETSLLKNLSTERNFYHKSLQEITQQTKQLDFLTNNKLISNLEKKMSTKETKKSQFSSQSLLNQIYVHFPIFQKMDSYKWAEFCLKNKWV